MCVPEYMYIYIYIYIYTPMQMLGQYQNSIVNVTCLTILGNYVFTVLKRTPQLP